jgi:hypothetical protein
LLQINGSRALIPLFFPVLATLMPLLLRKQWVRIIATILLGGFVLVGGFSIGVFYLPPAVMLLLASCVDDSAKMRDAFP